MTAAADVFSTGLLIVEMFTGERAVRGDVGEVFELIRHFDPALRANEIPERYRDIWVRMLAAEPAERPTMAQVAVLWPA